MLRPGHPRLKSTCPDSSEPIFLRVCYAMPGTDIAYAPTSRRFSAGALPPGSYAMSGTDILLVAYAYTMSSTDIAFAATRWPWRRPTAAWRGSYLPTRLLCDVRYWHGVQYLPTRLLRDVWY
eukprot:2189024-Rhodomonas_salina.2